MRVIFQNYTIKHISWSHEKEYRALKVRTEPEDSPGREVPVSDVGLSIDSVYTGFNCEYHNRIKEIADDLKVPCHKCKLDEKRFLIISD